MEQQHGFKINQISKEVQSMKNQNATDPWGNVGILVIRIASFGAAQKLYPRTWFIKMLVSDFFD